MSIEDLSSVLSGARAADIIGTEIAFGELTVTIKLDSLLGFLE